MLSQREADCRAVGSRRATASRSGASRRAGRSGTRSYRDSAAPLLARRSRPAAGARDARRRQQRSAIRAPDASRRRASTSSPATTASRCAISSATARKHNEANGEHNHDGESNNLSTNRGVEGPSDDPGDRSGAPAPGAQPHRHAARCRRACRCSARGDEMGRTQRGNNNAYCQDNEISWIELVADARAERQLLEFTRALIALRHAHPVLHRPPLLPRPRAQRRQGSALARLARHAR